MFSNIKPHFATLAGDYSGKDIEFLNDKPNRTSWQNNLYDSIFDESKNQFIVADDRKIIWIYDKKGKCGKSKWVKWLCANNPEDIIKLTFGSPQQLRSAIVSIGPKKVYLIDIPRTRDKSDSMESLINSLEEVKNGHVTSIMYGQYKTIFFEPPHVIVFSNERCPKQMMSEDRWEIIDLSNFK